jgi:photosystem II stability/assembly factor-like uncharacterized protein
MAPLQISDITDLNMTSADMGWALTRTNPGAVLHTADAASSWTVVTPPQSFGGNDFDLSHQYPFAFFLDNQTAWVIYDGKDMPVWHTTDGGSTWIRSFGTFYSQGAEFFFQDADNGWLIATVGPTSGGQVAHELYRTTDGGANWQVVVPYDAGVLNCSVTGIVFFDSQLGWITQSCSYADVDSPVLVTNDGGVKWDFVFLPPPSQNPTLYDPYVTPCRQFGLFSPFLFTSAQGALVNSCDREREGQITPPPDYMYRTLDGGTSWITSETPGRDVVFMSEGSVWVSAPTAEGLRILHSEDGGFHWSLIKTTRWNGTISFVSDYIAYAIARPLGDSLDHEHTKLVRTDDGGRTWQTVDSVIDQAGTP